MRCLVGLLLCGCAGAPTIEPERFAVAGAGDGGSGAAGSTGGQGAGGLADAGPDAQDAGSDAVGGSGGSSGDSGAGSSGGEGASGPDVYETTCDHVAASGQYYAVSPYPGETAIDLWDVTVMGHVEASVLVTMPDYRWELAPAVRRDGEVAAICQTTPRYDRVVFVRPRSP